ncbi:DUF1674 domain-containing protein [Sphingomonas arantia]|uniref:DUF1674 domain-containing protein n=1 Tax=Sphingomonas arantia TaxID=1460676 RepID=UPI0036D35F1E
MTVTPTDRRCAVPRPADFVPPKNLSPNPPVPTPEPIHPESESGGPKGLEPTRYGDWESKGIAWDF